MTTLTFRGGVDGAKECLRRYCSSMVKRKVYGDYWGWVQEYQERGVVHYHVIHCIEDLDNAYELEPSDWRKHKRGNNYVTVASGHLEEELVEPWLAIIPDKSMATVKFNYGGIVECISKPELAGWYLGRYTTKLAQKQLPPGEAPQGRWWWLSPAARPIMGEQEIVTYWPLKKPARFLFDSRRIHGDLDNSHLRNVPL